jgi:hypothetical protein
VTGNNLRRFRDWQIAGQNNGMLQQPLLPKSSTTTGICNFTGFKCIWRGFHVFHLWLDQLHESGADIR